jgi:hypothetical protein
MQLALDSVQEELVGSLQREGIAVVSFAELFDDPARWDALAEDMAQFVAEVEPSLPELRARDDRKAYIVRRFQKKKRTFEIDDPWLQFGLSSQVLDVVNAYRGSLMRLVDFDDWYTIPDAAAEHRVASQRWHRDPWDNHIVKVFVYFSDVDEEAGPFEYVAGSPAGGRYGHLWPWLDAHDNGVYPPQDELAEAVAPDDVRSLTGPPGTIIFCDTSGFHRGGWARSKPRVLSYHAYVAHGTKSPKFTVEGNGHSELTAPARFAVFGSAAG